MLYSLIMNKETDG